MIVQGKPREMPHKSDLNCQEVWLHDSPQSLLCAYRMYCILSPLNKYFTSFTVFHLCGNSFPQSWMARALSLTTGLVARIWCSYHRDPDTISGQGTEALLQAAAGRGHQDQFEMNFEG